jgi:hypothetical protein
MICAGVAISPLKYDIRLLKKRYTKDCTPNMYPFFPSTFFISTGSLQQFFVIPTWALGHSRNGTPINCISKFTIPYFRVCLVRVIRWNVVGPFRTQGSSCLIRLRSRNPLVPWNDIFSPNPKCDHTSKSEGPRRTPHVPHLLPLDTDALQAPPSRRLSQPAHSCPSSSPRPRICLSQPAHSCPSSSPRPRI